jgi:hypothetical protein
MVLRRDDQCALFSEAHSRLATSPENTIVPAYGIWLARYLYFIEGDSEPLITLPIPISVVRSPRPTDESNLFENIVSIVPGAGIHPTTQATET